MSLQNKPAVALPLEKQWSAKESWRLFGIMAEFVEGTERLDSIQPAVSIFGSARTDVNHPYYKLTEQIARLLSDAGFSVISGGGPGVMEAANKGAYYGSSPSIGLNIQLPHEQHRNPYQDISQSFRHFLRANTCSSNLPRLMSSCPVDSVHWMNSWKRSRSCKRGKRAKCRLFWSVPISGAA